jgi:hypothetical protein
MLMFKLPKRIIEWVSKAWTEFEKELPVFYREALARLLCLEHFFRNLIETQSLDAGTIVYTDHARPHMSEVSATKEGSHLEDPRDLRSHRDCADPL